MCIPVTGGGGAKLCDRSVLASGGRGGGLAVYLERRGAEKRSRGGVSVDDVVSSRCLGAQAGEQV